MAEQRPEDGKAPSTSANAAQAWQKSQPYFDAVWQLVGGVGLGVGGGYAVDRWLHTAPWGMVVGSVLGMTTGFIGFFRSITRAGTKSRSPGTRP